MNDHELFGRLIKILQNQQEEIERLAKEIHRQARDIEELKYKRGDIECDISNLRCAVASLKYRS